MRSVAASAVTDTHTDTHTTTTIPLAHARGVIIILMCKFK